MLLENNPPIPADSNIIILDGHPYLMHKKKHWNLPDEIKLYTTELNQVGGYDED